MAKNKIGNIFSIKTSKGKAYLHYVYIENNKSEFIRVLPGIYNDELNDVNEIVKQEELFFIHFPISAAFRKKIVQLEGFHAISENFAKPKYMRTIHMIRGEFLGWHIVDTDTWKMQLVQFLNDEQKRMSPWGTWNDTLLIKKIEDGWTLDKWDK